MMLSEAEQKSFLLRNKLQQRGKYHFRKLNCSVRVASRDRIRCTAIVQVMYEIMAAACATIVGLTAIIFSFMHFA